MNINKQKLAEVIRTRRAANGYTQNDLAEKTGISLRSIQRIEKGEVLPRSFTFRALEEILNFSDKDLIPAQNERKSFSNFGRVKRTILGVFAPLVLLMLAFAFIAQSPNFPETSFELSIYWAAVIFIIGVLQWIIWTYRRKISK